MAEFIEVQVNIIYDQLHISPLQNDFMNRHDTYFLNFVCLNHCFEFVQEKPLSIYKKLLYFLFIFSDSRPALLLSEND
jgi:hypothetical protein